MLLFIKAISSQYTASFFSWPRLESFVGESSNRVRVPIWFFTYNRTSCCHCIIPKVFLEDSFKNEKIWFYSVEFERGLFSRLCFLRRQSQCLHTVSKFAEGKINDTQLWNYDAIKDVADGEHIDLFSIGWQFLRWMKTGSFFFRVAMATC